MRTQILRRKDDVTEEQLSAFRGTLLKGGQIQILNAPQNVDGEWRCLANMDGCLVVIAVALSKPAAE